MEFYVLLQDILKRYPERINEDNRFIELAIPNKEVKYIFRTKIKKWFYEMIKGENLNKVL